MESPSEFSKIIRPSIHKTVDTILWMDQMDLQDTLYQQQLSEISNDKFERCMICTLPMGTCIHTQEWKDKYEIEQYIQKEMKSGLELEIDSAFDILRDDQVFVGNLPPIMDVDLEHMCWIPLQARQSDKIGASSLALYVPDDRLWHTTVVLRDKYVIVFGGFRCKNSSFQPFKTLVDENDIEYLQDLKIYDVENTSWHTVKYIDQQPWPKERYGHVAAPLDENRMLIFGGRGKLGVIFEDTWVYDFQTNTWLEIITRPDLFLTSPSSRFHAACSSHIESSTVYMFGGTNGVENYGEVWIFHGAERLLHWERAVIVGIPPSPRYGHQMIALGSDPNCLMVLGGCAVSPQSEMVGSNLSIEETMKLMDYNSNLQRKYKQESNFSVLSSNSLQLKLGDSTSSLEDIFHQASSISSQLHFNERDTRQAEQALVDALKQANANTQFNIHKARHFISTVDVYFLNIKTLSWEPRTFPKVTGTVPSCRMHFGCSSIGDLLFVIGGTAPTSLCWKHVDPTVSSIYVLDTKTMTWVSPTPINSKQYLQQSLNLAHIDALRAKNKIEEEKSRSLSLGAINIRTKEVALAEAMYNVCQWRYEMLQKQQDDANLSPVACFGATLTVLRQRLIFIGGWAITQSIRKGIIALDLEQELEKQRRLQEEFYSQLERQRQEEDARLVMQNMISAHELHMKILEEQRVIKFENNLMSKEDYLSSLPPLSRPPPVKFVKANQHTIWISWDRVLRDTKERIVDSQSITYLLYMKSSYERLLPQDRVIVAANPTASLSPSTMLKSKKSRRLAAQKLLQQAKPLEDLYFDEEVKRYSGVISKAHGNGTFDVYYDDGSMESKISRYRIKLLLQKDGPQSPQPFDFIQSNKKESEEDDKTIDSMSSLGNSTYTTTNKLLKKNMSKKGKVLDILNKFRAPRVNNNLGLPLPLNEAPSELTTARTNEFEEYRISPKDFKDGSWSAPSLPDDLVSLNATLSQDGKDKITVKPDSTWKLLYMGKDSSYVCNGLVPPDILEQEPNLVVSVMFCIQTHGLDWPSYERSQLSPPVIFHTIPSYLALKDTLNKELNESSSSKLPSLQDPTSVGMSKTKKEIISAVIKGQQLIQIEKRNFYYTSEGMGDDYL